MEHRRPVSTSTTDRTAAMLAAAQRSTFLGALARPDLEAVLERCRVVQARRGGTLLRPSEDAAVFLVRGAATATATTLQGSTTVVAVLGDDAVWGLSSTLGMPDDAIELTALMDCAGLIIPGRDLRGLISDRPAVGRAALRSVATDLAGAREEAVRFANTSATERVIHRIVDLSDRWGQTVDGQVVVTLPLTQDDLASWAQTSRESAAKALHELRRSGIIQTARRELVVLDLDRLRARIDPSRGGPDLQELLLSTG